VTISVFVSFSPATSRTTAFSASMRQAAPKPRDAPLVSLLRQVTIALAPRVSTAEAMMASPTVWSIVR
jgi:hypothetical protein